MQTHKMSVSIPEPLYDFLASYQQAHHYKSRSEVITKALRLLQQIQLEGLYCEANEELEDDFDSVAGDGLENETW